MSLIVFLARLKKKSLFYLVGDKGVWLVTRSKDGSFRTSRAYTEAAISVFVIRCCYELTVDDPSLYS